MVPGGLTERLWYFMGYLRLDEDDGRPRDFYNYRAHHNNPDDYTGHYKDSPSRPGFDDSDSAPTRLPPPPPDPATQFPHIHHLKAAPVEPPHHPHIGSLAQRPISGHGPGGGGGGGGGGHPGDSHYRIHVSYDEGGDQELVQIHQLNQSADDDVLTVNGVTPDLHEIDIDAVLHQMADDASAQTPTDLVLPTDTGSLAEFVAARDTAIAEQGGTDHEAVGPGRYVNGELQPEDASPSPTETEVTDTPQQPVLSSGDVTLLGAESQTADTQNAPPHTEFPPGEWADLGGNEATNAAGIVDANEAVRTMIVLGDYHHTDVIVQTNVLVDSDHVKVAGGAEDLQGVDASDGTVVTDGNKVDNIAEFIDNEGLYSAGTGRFSGLHWNVDTVHGDFYDVKCLVQTNALSDNDVVVQETQSSHYTVVAGDNEQLNLIDLTDLGQYYDVIIIGGNYYSGNFIYQTNLVLDNDVVKVLALGEDGNTSGAATDQQVITGQNELSNEGTITTYGGDDAQPISSNMYDFVSALANGATDLDPYTYGWTVPGNGTGVLNVLYIDGDYYDINAIWQINVISDVDTGIQLLSGDAAAAEDSVQSTNAGGNLVNNLAEIIDVGATNLFVGGDTYEDAILIQANIVTEEDTVRYGDVETLVPEVIAFTDAPAGDTDSEPIAPAPVDTASVDLLGQVMT